MDPIVSQCARRRQTSDSKDMSNLASPRNGAKLNRSASQSHRNLTKNPIITNQNIGSIINGKNKKKFPVSISADDQTINLSSLPQMSPYERYVCGLAHMNEVLLRNKTLNETISAQETCAILIEHVVRLTANKREILEKGLFDASKLSSDQERQKFQMSLRETVQKLRGKLDHASIVAYEVGLF